MDPSPAADTTPVANYSHVYRARSAAQVNLARNAAAGWTVLDNPDAEMPQYHTIIVDRAGVNYGVNLPGHPYMAENTNEDKDIMQHMPPAGHTHAGMDRSMMLLLNV
jgi:hypothetical protein